MSGRAQSVVAAVMIALLGWIILDRRGLRSEVASLRNEVHAEFGDLRDRMARLEGLFEAFTERKAAP